MITKKDIEDILKQHCEYSSCKWEIKCEWHPVILRNGKQINPLCKSKRELYLWVRGYVQGINEVIHEWNVS